jgi:hypothetical protein
MRTPCTAESPRQPPAFAPITVARLRGCPFFGAAQPVPLYMTGVAGLFKRGTVRQLGPQPRQMGFGDG